MPIPDHLSARSKINALAICLPESLHKLQTTMEDAADDLDNHSPAELESKLRYWIHMIENSEDRLLSGGSRHLDEARNLVAGLEP